MSKTIPELRVGSILDGRYRILRRLAGGSMGAVYRGERLKLGRPVAIKFLHPQIEAEPQFKERFEREALAMSQLAHPNCVSVIDFGRSNGAPYIVMDFAEGKSLQDVLAQGRLVPARAVALSRQILAGLEHAHRQGVVHRDIKPSNVMLTEYPLCGEVARLVDFGLAALRGKRKRREITNSEVVVGTPSYMSPEQTRGHSVDRRSDVYGLGVVLFQMLTGQRPFEADDTLQMLRLHQEAPIPNLGDRVVGVKYSLKLQQVVRRSLAKSPDDRFPSALAFAEALSDVPEASSTRKSPTLHKFQAYKPTPSLSILQLPTHRRKWLAVAAVFTLFIAGGSVALKKLRSDQSVAHKSPPVEETVDEIKLVVAPEPEVTPVAIPNTVPVADELAETDEEVVEVPADAEPAAEPIAEPVPVQEAVAQVTTDPETAEIGNAESDAMILARPPEMKNAIQARAAFKAGFRVQALEALEQMRRDRPKLAPISLALGDLYFENGQKVKALKRYKRAIDQDRSFKKRRVLQKNVISALADKKTKWIARRIILYQLKDRAASRLRRASKRADDPLLRDEAGKLHARLIR